MGRGLQTFLMRIVIPQRGEESAVCRYLGRSGRKQIPRAKNALRNDKSIMGFQDSNGNDRISTYEIACKIENNNWSHFLFCLFLTN